MPAIESVLIRDEAWRQHADDLAPVGVPERERVQDGAGAERGDEGVDLRDFDKQAVDQANQRAASDDDQDGQRPRDAEFDLQG